MIGAAIWFGFGALALLIHWIFDKYGAICSVWKEIEWWLFLLIFLNGPISFGFAVFHVLISDKK
jgi:hypothetical protein